MKTDYTTLNTSRHLEISDLALASTLQYLDFAVVAINKDPKDHPKVTFIFEKTEELSNAIYRYWEGLLLVEPKFFWNIARELKSRIRTH